MLTWDLESSCHRKTRNTSTILKNSFVHLETGVEEIGFLLIFQKNGTPIVSESMATCCDCVCAMIAASAPALPVLGKFCFRFVFS